MSKKTVLFSVRYIGLGILLGGAIVLAGCGNTAPQSSEAKTATPGRIENEWGVSFTAPSGWTEDKKTAFSVPGRLVSALVPTGFPTASLASITVFTQAPGKNFTPRELLDMSVAPMKQGGFKLGAQEIRTVVGMKAMWVEDSAMGTGGAITPAGGTVPTAQIWVGIPRGSDILVLLLTTPEKNLTTDKAAFESVVQSLKITGEQTPEQKAST